MFFFRKKGNYLKKNCPFLGYLRARLSFSKPPQTDLTLLMYSESTALLEIPKTGKVKLSYVPK